MSCRSRDASEANESTWRESVASRSRCLGQLVGPFEARTSCSTKATFPAAGVYRSHGHREDPSGHSFIARPEDVRGKPPVHRALSSLFRRSWRSRPNARKSVMDCWRVPRDYRFNHSKMLVQADMSFKQRSRERVHPKMGKLDIDYQAG